MPKGLIDISLTDADIESVLTTLNNASTKLAENTDSPTLTRKSAVLDHIYNNIVRQARKQGYKP